MGMTRDEMRDAEIVVEKLVNSEQENWRQMERLLMVAIDRAIIIDRCRLHASNIKKLVGVLRETMKDMGLSEAQMRTLEVSSSHILDRCNEIFDETG